eukprot:TRINITY_DN9475_c0_g1_i1.p1 TRINITY_DN9475_c0_g1~~TRINITY_DN9475_c0_g1_i1.p1  ORF type:complete len:352 (-),score=35.25 TRINITY_DN9475_c0_g1_i1:30-1085(-)
MESDVRTQLYQTFVDVPQAVVDAVLHDSGGDAEIAADRLLSMGRAEIDSYLSPVHTSSNPSAFRQPHTSQGVQPTCLVLQGDVWRTSAPHRHVYCTSESDSEFYRRTQSPSVLQRDEPPRLHFECPDGCGEPMSRTNSNYSGAVHAPTAAQSASTEVNLAALLLRSKDNFERTRDSVKRTLLPVVVEHLTRTKVPAISEAITIPRVGEVHFGCSEIGIEELQADPEDAQLELHPEGIHLSAVGLRCQLRKFDWWYRKDSFPRIRDSGKLAVSLSRCAFYVVVDVLFTPAGPRLVVPRADLQIGRLNCKVSGTMGSFLYNPVLAALRSAIKSSIEQSFRQSIANSAAQMRED